MRRTKKGRILTQKQMQALKPYEKTLSTFKPELRRHSAVNSVVKSELAKIYRSIINSNSCLSCSNQWMKTLAGWYFENLKTLQ